MKGYHEHQDTSRGTRWRWMISSQSPPCVVVTSVDRQRRGWSECPASLLQHRSLLASAIRDARRAYRCLT